MTSPIVSLLAQRPPQELRENLTKAHEELARLQVEVRQFEEAIAKQARSRGSSRPTRRRQTGTTRKRLLDLVAAQSEPISPAEIIAGLREQGVTVHTNSIHTMIARLVKAGELERLGQGQYQLASRNGDSADAESGPQRNEATEPLSLATESQEAR